MSERTRVDLGPVQETLLIPLLGRAEATRKGGKLLHDPKAVEIVESLDYDFSRWAGRASLQGACLRTRMYDDEVRAFLRRHPRGTVVEIGAGLNTRYERLDNGEAMWVELDLPDSMALRRRFFADTERRRMISASVLDTDWFDDVEALPAPYIFVSEAVIIYLDAPDVERAMRSISHRFPGSTLLMDTTSTAMVDSQRRHDTMRTLPRESWFRWRCDAPESLARWGLALESSKTFLDAPDELIAGIPFVYRLVARYAPWLIRKKLSGYRINLFRLSPAATP